MALFTISFLRASSSGGALSLVVVVVHGVQVLGPLGERELLFLHYFHGVQKNG
jgi:hypothetical protein